VRAELASDPHDEYSSSSMALLRCGESSVPGPAQTLITRSISANTRHVAAAADTRLAGVPTGHPRPCPIDDGMVHSWHRCDLRYPTPACTAAATTGGTWDWHIRNATAAPTRGLGLAAPCRPAATGNATPGNADERTRAMPGLHDAPRHIERVDEQFAATLNAR